MHIPKQQFDHSNVYLACQSLCRSTCAVVTPECIIGCAQFQHHERYRECSTSVTSASSLSVMVCILGLDKRLHKSLHVNSCQLLVTAMSACRFQADSVIFLHDEQPHVEYLPTKVPTLPPTPSLLCCTISTPVTSSTHHICVQQHH